MAIYYPDAFTDTRWKRQEQKLGVSNTGLGARLRDLQKSAKRFDAACAQYLAHTDGEDAMEPAHATIFKKLHGDHVRAIDACWVVCGQNMKKTKGKNDKAHAFFDELGDSLERYKRLWTDFDPADRRGLNIGLDRIDQMVRHHNAEFEYR